jgi:hypothetical protein
MRDPARSAQAREAITADLLAYSRSHSPLATKVLRSSKDQIYTNYRNEGSSGAWFTILELFMRYCRLGAIIITVTCHEGRRRKTASHATRSAAPEALILRNNTSHRRSRKAAFEMSRASIKRPHGSHARPVRTRHKNCCSITECIIATYCKVYLVIFLAWGLAWAAPVNARVNARCARA